MYCIFVLCVRCVSSMIVRQKCAWIHCLLHACFAILSTHVYIMCDWLRDIPSFRRFYLPRSAKSAFHEYNDAHRQQQTEKCMSRTEKNIPNGSKQTATKYKIPLFAFNEIITAKYHVRFNQLNLISMDRIVQDNKNQSAHTIPNFMMPRECKFYQPPLEYRTYLYIQYEKNSISNH